MISLTEHLNPVQLEAATHTEGPLLILAGAGSGKTRTITYRIFHLIEEKSVRPWNILAVTFTNKAASEMRGRVQALLSHSDGLSVWVSTFHSACVRILRQHIGHLGLSNAFSIIDANDQVSIVKKCIQEVDDHPQSLHHYVVLEEIRRAKNELRSPQKYADSIKGDFRLSRVARVFFAYEKKLRENEAMDFDDLLFFTCKLFQEQPEILEYYRNRCRYIMVDEYQDTNHAQATMLYLLAEKHQNICVVGDDDQSIYRWRGADIHNILDFEKVYPQTRVIRLEQNYRSTQTILKAANRVILHNDFRKPKELWTTNEEGARIDLYEAFNEQDEARFISRQIQSLHKLDFPHYSDFGILYRTNAQSRAVEEALRNDGLPYIIVGGLKFYERKEIKDLMAYLKIISNPDNQLSLQRIINVPPRKIGQGTLAKIESLAGEYHLSLFQALLKIADSRELRAGQEQSLTRFLSLIRKWRKFKDEHSVSQLLELVIKDTDYLAYLAEEKSDLAENRIENVRELVSGIQYFEKQNPDSSLEHFLDYVSLLTDIDEYRDESGSITLMTVHSAKGLEFPAVFMAGMEEKLFPVARNIFNPEDLEEERRLCYVGMTRAQKRLFLTYAACRTIYGTPQYNLISRFIREIPSHLFSRQPAGTEQDQGQEAAVDLRNSGGGHQDRIDHFRCYIPKKRLHSMASPMAHASRSRLYPHAAPGSGEYHEEDFRTGDRVCHERWGEGLVLYTEGEGENRKVMISFGGLKKKLLIKYARLEKI